MVRLLSNEEIESNLSIEDYLPYAERLFEELARERAVNTEIQATYAPVPEPPEGASEPVYHMMRNMGGVIETFEVAGMRLNSDVIHWPEKAGTREREKLPVADGRYNGFVVIFDLNTGEPRVIFPDGFIQTFHVATGVSLGAKYLARDDASTLGMIGAGHQARTHLPAICHTCDIDTVYVFAPSEASRRTFETEMGERVSANIEAVTTARAAVERADIVNCATSSLSPVFETEWLSPGTHLGYIKTNEPPDDFFSFVDTFVMAYPSHPRIERDYSGAAAEVEVPPSHWYFYNIEGDEPTPAIRTRAESPDLGSEITDFPRLSDIMIGAETGRETDEEVTAVKQAGRGVDFVAIGYVLAELAEEHGLGTELSTDLFTQEYTP